jgi:diguanylate cyclase (GGDEF)-like protein/PAS domain S-box-containing protein
MVTTAGPVIVASRDILTSAGEGPSRGRIAMGKALDAEFIRELGRRMGLDLQFWVVDAPDLPAQVNARLKRGGAGTLVTIADGETGRLDAYRMVEGMDDQPAVIIGAKLPREMMQSASYISRLCVLWIVFQGGLLIFIIMVPLHRAIIAPLGVLSRQLRAFRKTSDLNVNLDTESGGEIGEISREFGKMLRQLEDEIRERRKGEEGLRRAAAVFDTATESIVIANSAGIILDVNSAFSATTGFSHSEMVGRAADELTVNRQGVAFFVSIIDEVTRVGKWEGEIWVRHKEGNPIPAWISVGCTVGDADHIERVVMVFNDMTERKKSEAVIAHQANYDMLTKLPNRYLFMDRLRRALLRAKRDGSSVGLLFIDLDEFKKINDTLGHAAGDEALRHAAARISQTLREADTAARLGGDEFAIILPEIQNGLDVEGIAQRILAAIAVPLEVHKEEVVLTASIGIALYPADSDNDEDLLRDSDVAMYRCKQDGGNSLKFFTEEMNESAARRLQVETQLWKALELGELELYYQPIVALPEARWVGVEALLRWDNSLLGVVSPAEFIPIAERSGLIVPIGAWVLETACRQVKAWHDADWPALRVAVNLSPREVDRGDAVNSIRNALERSGLPAEYLEIEVTERVLLDDVERIATTFAEIKQLGVRLCIDDFGTGYSSLSYLQSFPFDVLKIDRAFVSGAVGHEDGVSLLRAINSMAESLHLEVVAEGVETREQMVLLSELGCGFAQGYYFCRPMSAERLEMGDPIAALRGGSPASD